MEKQRTLHYLATFIATVALLIANTGPVVAQVSDPISTDNFTPEVISDESEMYQTSVTSGDLEMSTLSPPWAMKLETSTSDVDNGLSTTVEEIQTFTQSNVDSLHSTTEQLSTEPTDMTSMIEIDESHNNETQTTTAKAGMTDFTNVMPTTASESQTNISTESHYRTSMDTTVDSIDTSIDFMDSSTEPVLKSTEVVSTSGGFELVSSQSLDSSTEYMDFTVEYKTTIPAEYMDNSTEMHNMTSQVTLTQHFESSTDSSILPEQTSEDMQIAHYFWVYAFYLTGNCSLLGNSESFHNDFVTKLRALDLIAVQSINNFILHNRSCDPFRLIIASNNELNTTALMNVPVEIIHYGEGNETMIFTLIDVSLLQDRQDESNVTMTTEPTTERLMTNSSYLMTFRGECSALGFQNEDTNYMFVANENLMLNASSIPQDTADNFSTTQNPLGETDDVTTTSVGDNNINQLTTVAEEPHTNTNGKMNITVEDVTMETISAEQTDVLITMSTTLVTVLDTDNGAIMSTANKAEITTEMSTEKTTAAASHVKSSIEPNTDDVTTQNTQDSTTDYSTTQSSQYSATDISTKQITQDLKTESSTIMEISTGSTDPMTTPDTINLTDNETRALRSDFELKLRYEVSNVLDIGIERVIVNNLLCGSVIANITIVDTNGNNFDSLMSNLTDDNFAIEVMTERNETFVFLLNAVSMYEPQTSVPVYPTSRISTESPEDDGLTETQIILIIVFAVIGATLILLLITFICCKCCGARHSKSFTLRDTPSRQYDTEDFSLTKMNRPTPMYTDQGLIMNTELNSTAPPPRPMSVYSNPVYGPTNGYFDTFPPHPLDANNKTSTENLVQAVPQAPHNSGHDNLSYSSEDMLDPGHGSDPEYHNEAHRHVNRNSMPEASSRM